MIFLLLVDERCFHDNAAFSPRTPDIGFVRHGLKEFSLAFGTVGRDQASLVTIPSPSPTIKSAQNSLPGIVGKRTPRTSFGRRSAIADEDVQQFLLLCPGHHRH